MAEEAAKPEPAVSPRSAPRPRSASGGIGEVINAQLFFVGDTAILAFRALRTLMRYGVDMRDLMRQFSEIGADSVWIVLANAGTTGAVFTIYLAKLATQFGAIQFIGSTLSYSFLNELGPMLAGVAVASRSGAAIAAEIGSMVVTEQVDALRAMAVSPVRYLVVPRVLAAFLSMPLLTVIADFVGLLGGYATALAFGVTPANYFESVRQFTQPSDLTRGLIKGFVFGYLIGLIACQQGLQTHGGATGVGRATTSSVVRCVVAIFVAELFLTLILTNLLK
jgi:phospholipid/cholesterol/gamma-HCH transport system permease protein